MVKRKVNKSEVIREAIAKHPKAGPSGIVQLLADQGTKVTAQLVSNVKARTGGSKKRGRQPANRAGGEMTIKQLMAAASFAKQMGGLEQASVALAALERLR